MPPVPSGRFAVAAAILLIANAPASADPAPSPADAEFFEKRVRPLLVDKCVTCHGPKKAHGGLRLDSRDAVLKGGETGPGAVAGAPADSLLVKAVRHVGDLKMPPKGDKLTDAEAADLETWVRRGLPWPATSASAATGLTITDEHRKYWAFRPVAPPAPPAVKDATWAVSPIDRFILADLEALGLKPAAPADKRTLIRRLTFDLTGLPPTPAETDAFLADDSPAAFARVVDRLLASPAYGERWARHWLDVARYTDSFDARVVEGAGNTMDVPEIHRYRDWVVKALNADLPYDQFVKLQIAGDLLPGPAPGTRNPDGVVATGLLAIGNWGGGDSDKEKLLTDIADDQIDVVGRGFLGLTLACARCHDHKFDPITAEDYYGLAGIFFSSHILENPGPKTNGPPMLRIPLLSEAERADRRAKEGRAAELEKQVKALGSDRAAGWGRREAAHTGRYLLTAAAYARMTTPPPAETFAREAGLHPVPFRRFADLLVPTGFKPLKVEARDIFGRPGVHSLSAGGPSGTPVFTVNTTDRPAAYSSITLPPRAVAVHPGPASGVAVAWRSPVAGRVTVAGRVADADGTCGNGVDWSLEHRPGRKVASLARGGIVNGGAQPLSPAPLAVDVAAGDELRLTVTPKGEYTCDSTVVELRIAQAGGAGRTWDLTRDVLAGPDDRRLANPRADAHGHPEVWHFGEADDRKPAAPGGPDGPVARWVAAFAGRAGPAELERLAAEVDKAAADPKGKLVAELTAPSGPFALSPADSTATLPADERAKLDAARTELAALRKALVAPTPFAHGCLEGGCPDSPQAGTHDVKVHIRGRYDRLGKLVPRRFPVVLAGENQPPITDGSGRRQLAEWVASPTNPLTARVMANRVWQHHFGEGLVRTPGNFGQLGERPTHPALLDYLADRFVKAGWSVKALHREILLSAAYRQSSEADLTTLKADPDNRLFGRMNRRRLDAEELRDALLAAAGTLDRAMGGKAVRDPASTRRTLYQMTMRSDRSTFRELFDAADPTAVVDRRAESTVAPQALFMLNHPFVAAQTKALAGRAAKEASGDAGRVDWLYRTLFGRPPTPRETAVGLAAVGQLGGWEAYCQVLLCANEFVYVD